MPDRDIGYRDQWEADVDHGICPICGPPYRNGPGPDCHGCNPPVREYVFDCHNTIVTDDEMPYCPEHGATRNCRVVRHSIVRPPVENRTHDYQTGWAEDGPIPTDETPF